MRELNLKVGIALLLGMILGAALFGHLGTVAPATAASALEQSSDDDLSRLQARVAMVAVDYHSSNLWFAGKAENWPLADYYWKQTLEHIQFSTKVKGNNDPKLAEIAAGIERSPNAQIGAAIARKDLRQFLVTYRTMLEGCYNCHKAAGLPFLKPRMPAPPASSIITVDANAPWPR
jgi:hypothetical protein